jgi:galactokinase
VTAQALGDLAAAAFSARFGRPADGTWFAPGRVNLIGEHTDYNGGFVLPFALGTGVAVAAARRDDATLNLCTSLAAGEVSQLRLADLQPGSVPGWAAYPAGVAWALQQSGLDVRGADIAIEADLAPGAGLSSSAAVESATGLALTELSGLTVSRQELVGLAQRAENDFVGTPTGIMDQSAALLSVAGHALLLDCLTRASSAVPFDPAAHGLAVLVIDTRTRHAHADGGYRDRRLQSEQAAHALGAPSLRQAAESDPTGQAGEGIEELVNRVADPVLRRRARHVLTENDRVLRVVTLLADGDTEAIGPLLTASHASLRDDFEVSWPQADVVVETAIQAGALGGRMMGGGFGGSVVALVPAQHEQIRRAISEGFSRRGWPAPGYLSVTPSASARRLA